MIAILMSIGFGFVGWLVASLTDMEILALLGMLVGVLSPVLYMTEKIYKIKMKETAALQRKIKEMEKQLEDKPQSSH